MNTPDSDNLDALDHATAKRLARLRTLPVDTSRLETSLRAQLPTVPNARATWVGWMLRPMRIAAALLIVSGLVGALLFWSSRPALASPARLAEIHEEMVSDSCGAMKADSIDAARKLLASHWPGSPALPDLPQCQTMSCCTHRIGWHKVACLCLKSGNADITMAVADASKLRLPVGPTVSRDGVTYCVQSSNGVNIISTHRGGRWICLMGKVPAEQLVTVASGMRL